MQAKDIMTTSVISVPQDGKVEDAVRLMLDHHVSALPVVDADGALKGVVSEGDLMRRVRDTDGPRHSSSPRGEAAATAVAVRTQTEH